MTKKPLRILAASDLHGDTSLTKKLSDRAKKERADLILLCGDITGFEETPGLLKPFKHLGQSVVIIPGNWDDIATTDFLAKHYGIKNLHGYSLIHDNIGVFGAGGAEGPGPNRTSEKDLLTTLEKAHKDLEKAAIHKKIMITHMHPANTASECSGIAGSKAITEAAKR